MGGASALEFRDVTFRYPGAESDALSGVNLTVEPGVRVALVGPNGAGKSTLLKVAAGLLPAYAGTVRIYGNPPGACHHRVAYLEQRADVDWTFPMSVRRMALTGRYVHRGWFRGPRGEDSCAADASLERLGIGHLARRRIGELSGGQQQRALLARALAQEADLLLFDEPLNAVDAATRDAVFDVLEELRAMGRTVLMATHELGRLAAGYDSVVHFDGGRVTHAAHSGGDPACDECAPLPAQSVHGDTRTPNIHVLAD